MAGLLATQGGDAAVAIDDEDAGEFVTVKQDNGAAAGKISINHEDWPQLREAIDQMIKECR